jgi:hypothetical protein
MSTHINAYYAEVSEKEVKVAEAQAELEGAKQRLHDKQVELGIAKESQEEEGQAPGIPAEEQVVRKERQPKVDEKEKTPKDTLLEKGKK